MTITLLSALPHSREAVEAARLDPSRDFVHAMLLGYKTPTDVVWSRIEPTLGELAERVFRSCRGRGVEVELNAGRRELACAARSSSVVIVLAHWKGPTIERLPNDVRALPGAVVDRLEACVRAGLIDGEELTAVLAPASEQLAKERLADVLNRAVDRWCKWLPALAVPGVGADTLLISAVYGRQWARSLIDEMLGEKNLLPGARLELTDGLWCPSDLAGCFPPGWRGVCDFVCCTSEYLSEELKVSHPGALFRADSRLLYPKNVLPAIDDVVCGLTDRTPDDDDLHRTYLALATQSDHKHGAHTA